MIEIKALRTRKNPAVWVAEGTKALKQAFHVSPSTPSLLSVPLCVKFRAAQLGHVKEVDLTASKQTTAVEELYTLPLLIN
eukprot:scaffold2799_cov159-Ochromonas_danica.AAC.34